MIRLPIIPLFILAAAVVGCQRVQEREYQTEYVGPTNSCHKLSDCTTGYCDKTRGICAQESPLKERQIHVVFTPKKGPSQTFPVEFSNTNDASIQLDMPLDFEPRVTHGDLGSDSPNTTTKASVYFFDKQTLPGDSPRIITTESSPQINTPQISLLPGKNRYNIYIVPKNTDEPYVPPLYLENMTLIDEDGNGVLVDESGNTVPSIDLETGDIAILGEVRAGIQPLHRVRVQAVDPINHRPISTPATTQCQVAENDAVCGQFEIKMRLSDMGDDPENFKYALRIERDDDPSYPVATIFSSSATLEGERLIFKLPPLPNPTRFNARVEGKVILQDSIRHDGLEGCFLIFESREQSGSLLMEKVTYAGTNYMGTVHGNNTASGVLLYPSDQYDIHVLPPSLPLTAPIQYGIYRELRGIDSVSTSSDVNTPRTFELPFKQRHTGRVVYKKETIEGATLTASPILSNSPYTPNTTSITHKDGRLSLWLDPGLYRVTAMTPMDASFAYKIFNYRIDNPETERQLQTPITRKIMDISPEIPIIADLTLESDAENPPDGWIEWYETVGTDTVKIGDSRVKKGKTIGLLPSSFSENGSK